MARPDAAGVPEEVQTLLGTICEVGPRGQGSLYVGDGSGLDESWARRPEDKAERIGTELSAQGIEVLLDDRPKMSAGVKFADSELLGMPLVLVVGRGLAQGTVELRVRATGKRREVAVADAVETVAAAVRAELDA